MYRGHFNVVNNGRITNLPPQCVVEIPGYVDRTGINMPVVGDLPLACAATCSRERACAGDGRDAAVEGDVTLLKQAMLHDPLVGAVCNPEEVWQMTDEMLVAQAEWLPQYARQIEAAERRLADAERNGTRVRLRDTAGAARITTKSVEELALDREAARANAAAADKGKMTQRAMTLSSAATTPFAGVESASQAGLNAALATLRKGALRRARPHGCSSRL